jgi:hypothetical protein
MAPRSESGFLSSLLSVKNSKNIKESSSITTNGTITSSIENSNNHDAHYVQHDEDTQSLSLSSRTKKIIFFKIGALRFGVHGVMGILSMIIVIYALLLSTHHKRVTSTTTVTTTPNLLSILIVISTLIVAIDSYSLLHQVPLSSKITSFIIPPHREAFKRTIAMTVYINMRLCQEWEWLERIIFHLVVLPATTTNIHSVDATSHYQFIMIQKVCSTLFYPFIFSTFTCYHFYPFKANMLNGNTWVFIFPMWLGVSIDTYNQFLYLLQLVLPFTASVGRSTIMMNEFWNRDVINEQFLLITMFCTLFIAFMFTLSFRGYMNIKKCYWISALIVGFLCYRVIISTY